jgi:NifU-like protein
MGREALEVAIHNYRTGESEMKHLDDHIVCTCFGISENEIRRIVTENSITDIEDVTNYCKAGGGCGMCQSDIQKIIDKVENDRSLVTPPAKPKAAKKLTNLQKIKLIEEIVEREIRPRLQKDGGDIDLIDIVGDQVIIAFRGMCAGCQSSSFTRQDFIQGKLREFVSPEITVTEEGK